ncbi:MAG: hypothetical protein WBW31_23750 [Candidatus Sulfotelmatobacter sp.]
MIPRFRFAGRRQLDSFLPFYFPLRCTNRKQADFRIAQGLKIHGLLVDAQRIQVFVTVEVHLDHGPPPIKRNWQGRLPRQRLVPGTLKAREDLPPTPRRYVG